MLRRLDKYLITSSSISLSSVGQLVTFTNQPVGASSNTLATAFSFIAEIAWRNRYVLLQGANALIQAITASNAGSSSAPSDSFSIM